MSHVRAMMMAVVIGALLWAAAPARAIFHLFSVAEVFTSADGTVQFVRLHSNAGSQNVFAGQTFTCSNADGTVVHSITFPVNLSGNTTNRDVLIATANFASVPGGVAPDFVIPANFIILTNATVNFAGVSFVTYAQLPTDGQHSINIAGVAAINTPRNYAGASGSVNVPPGQCCTGMACAVTIQISCAGTWTAGAACGSGACGAPPTGACCAGTGCAITNQGACAGAWTDGGLCAPSPCVGQCCAASGACAVTLQSACTGAWVQNGACLPNTCPQPSGACCNGTMCSSSTAAACTGAFMGAGVVCGTVSNPTTCCPANYDRTGGLSVADIYVFLSDWFVSTPRADFDGVDGITVRDIFAFLGAWFAGCS